MALEQGAAFAASSARATLQGVSAVALFCTSYGLCSQRLTWPLCAISAFGSFFLLAALFDRQDNVTLAGASTVAVTTTAAALLFAPKPSVFSIHLRPCWWDLP